MTIHYAQRTAINLPRTKDSQTQLINWFGYSQALTASSQWIDAKFYNYRISKPKSKHFTHGTGQRLALPSRIFLYGGHWKCPFRGQITGIGEDTGRTWLAATIAKDRSLPLAIGQADSDWLQPGDRPTHYPNRVNGKPISRTGNWCVSRGTLEVQGEGSGLGLWVQGGQKPVYSAQATPANCWYPVSENC